MPPAPTAVDAQALVRFLGGAPTAAVAEAAVPTRYALVGVLAGTRSGHGAALISMDSKPAKPYRVGAEVDGGLVLQSVGRREARLGASVDGATSMTLQIPLKNLSAQSSTGASIAPPPPFGAAAPAAMPPFQPTGYTPTPMPASAAGNANPPPNPGDR